MLMCPYARGVYPRDLLSKLWTLMEAEDATKYVFYEHFARDERFSTRGDLTQFIEFFADPKKALFVILAKEKNEIAGLMWLEGVVAGVRAIGGFWMRRRYWGEMTREAVNICLEYVFDFLHIPTVWGFTPWLTSVKTTNALGWNYVCSLPDWTQIEVRDKYRAFDMHISYIRKEDFNYGRR